MGASANATTVLYGTPWDGESLLEQQKQVNLELERKDGIQRHFHYDWQEVARHNPNYGVYVAGEEARLGSNHPLFRTQYCLEPLHGGLELPLDRALLALRLPAEEGTAVVVEGEGEAGLLPGRHA